MATKIVLNKKNSNDEFGIISIQSFDGGKKKKSLGIKVNVIHFQKYFNSKFQLFEPNKEFDYDSINTQIKDGVYKFINDIPIEKPKQKDKLVVSVHKILKTEKIVNDRLSFIEYFESRMALKKTEGHRYSVLNVLRKLKKYLTKLGKDDLYFDELTPEFFVMFKNYCLSVSDPKKLTENGVRNYFKVIKSVYHDAYNTGYFVFPRNPFALIKNESGDKIEKNPLTINQVQALMELELDNKLRIARNIFYFQILSNGMRCSDVVFIRYGDFKNGRLSYKMMKTNTHLKIAIGLKIMLILAEILGEIGKYKELIETIPVSDRDILGQGQFTVKQLEEKIIESCPQIGFPSNSSTYEGYKGYTIKTADSNIKRIIDLRIETIEDINNLFLEYMQEVINKRDDNEFVFLNDLHKKSVPLFKDYKKGDVLTYVQFQKYRVIRNSYNLSLYKITEIYNDLIPIKTKDRWKYVIKLSSHVARNTFVSILLKENVDVYKISNALAHTELKTTQNYIKSGVDRDASDEAGLVIQNAIKYNYQS